MKGKAWLLSVHLLVKQDGVQADLGHDFNADSASGKRRQKGYFVSRSQGNIAIHELLVDGDSVRLSGQFGVCLFEFPAQSIDPESGFKFQVLA
jgi:hypothetical protein